MESTSVSININLRNLLKIHTSIYKVVFALLLFFMVAFPSVEFVYGVSAIVSFFLLLETRVKLSRSVINFVAFLGVILGITVVTSLFYNYDFFDRIRDIIHLSKPIVLVLAAYLLMKKIDDPVFVLRTIIYVSFVFAVYHFWLLLTEEFKRKTIEELRLRAGADNFIEMIGLVILIAFNQCKGQRLVARQTRALLILVLAISGILYFSRTMYFGFAALLLSVYGYARMSRKFIEYATVFLFFFGIFYAYLFTLELDQYKPGVQSFFYKIRNTPAEIFTAPDGYNPRNHKEIFDHWRGYEASLTLEQMKENYTSFFIGKGAGALVDLGFKAPIGGDDGLRFIPHVHNGYVYVLFKAGALGLLFYLILLINLYKQCYRRAHPEEQKFRNVIAGLGIYFMVTSLVITGLYNLEEVAVFVLGIFFYLAYEAKQITEFIKENG